MFANILAAPLVHLAPEIGAALKSGGVAILSGLLRTQEDRVLEAYLPLGFKVEQDHPPRRLERPATAQGLRKDDAPDL